MERRLHLIAATDLPATGVFGRDLPLREYRRALGSTRRADLFYDASGGLHPDAFAALAGTLAAGHSLYLHLPAHYPDGDPDHRRFLPYGGDIAACAPHFNQRLRRLARTAAAETHPQTCASPLPARTRGGEIFLGARGSGKSTALAARLQDALVRGERVLLVAPFAENCAAAEAALAALSPRQRARLTLLPPDEACRRLPSAMRLLVDEASAVAPAQLLALTTHYPDYTLAATTEGYEGSASLFSQQILPQFRAAGAQLHTFTCTHRYRQGDALDRLLQTVFFPCATAAAADGGIEYRQLSQAALAEDEALLAQLWGLLRQAHYRSRPQDLKNLLDLPEQHLFAAFSRSSGCLGVVQIVCENPLPAALIGEIIAGRRRPRGRLLMQQLLLHRRNPADGARTLARVQRIAVAAHCRRRHLGSRLLAFAHASLPELTFGTVHSHQEAVAAFWDANGYAVVHRRPHSRSRHLGATTLRLFTPDL